MCWWCGKSHAISSQHHSEKHSNEENVPTCCANMISWFGKAPNIFAIQCNSFVNAWEERHRVDRCSDKCLSRSGNFFSAALCCIFLEKLSAWLSRSWGGSYDNNKTATTTPERARSEMNCDENICPRSVSSIAMSWKRFAENGKFTLVISGNELYSREVWWKKVFRSAF